MAAEAGHDSMAESQCVCLRRLKHCRGECGEWISLIILSWTDWVRVGLFSPAICGQPAAGLLMIREHSG